MPSSGSVFSATLQSITTTKLNELSKNRARFEEQYSSLKAAAALEKDPLKRVFLLIDGVKTSLSIKTVAVKEPSKRLGSVVIGGTNNPSVETDLAILDRLIEQARFDPSISPKTLAEWEKTLRQHLDVQSLKHQYATLYGELVTEWLSSDGDISSSSADGDGTSEPFETVLDHKKLEARAEWEEIVFQQRGIDLNALKAYLNGLFGKRTEDENRIPMAFEKFKQDVEDFEAKLASPHQFNGDTLQWAISGLISSDLLTDEKRAVLKDFLENEVILSEIADVLNMRIAALRSWSWDGDVPAEQRRTINGSYNIHLHEDVLQAIFLHYVGVKWSVFLRTALGTFRRQKGVWKQLHKPIPKAEKRRRDYFLGPEGKSTNVQKKRQKMYLETYFMSQLPLTETQKIEIEEGDEEADVPRGPVTKQTARKATGGMVVQAARMHTGGKATQERYRNDAEPDTDFETDYEEGGDMPKRPMEAKQQLLHLLSTEIAINVRIHGELTCFRSAFDRWNTNLPHATILTVLTHLGVSKRWLAFFNQFLEAPIKFIDEDSEARTRKRGTPGSHSLSEFFGEAVLFCLDFSVNQNTDGLPLWRMHDEFFFWSATHVKCINAWDTIKTFEGVMGVSLNESKSGAARIGSDSKTTPLPLGDSLPQGKIQWGFLYLDSKTGQFEIDQSMIDDHIEELRHQLQDKPKSIFSWIQTWNTFATTFITSNFGKPANCYGREHVDKILSTHERIHRAIFPSHGSVVEHLKICLKERFGAENVPDGFLFFPIELGGLNLRSSFVGPLQIRDRVVEKPSTILDNFERAERQAYIDAKQRFEKGEIDHRRHSLDDPDWEPVDKDVFMSFEEFIRYREDERNGFQGELVEVFDELLKQPYPNDINHTSQVLNATTRLTGETKGILRRWYAMDAYWKWVAQLYGPEMIDRFGGLNIVDPGLLPIGMVSLFRNQTVNWSG